MWYEKNRRLERRFFKKWRSDNWHVFQAFFVWRMCDFFTAAEGKMSANTLRGMENAVFRLAAYIPIPKEFTTDGETA